LLHLTLRCSTRIGDFVRRLILIGATHGWYRQHCGHLAMLFPLVIQLEIRNTVWTDAEIKPTMTLGGLKSVTHLSFTNVNFPSPMHLQKTLSSYPQCDTLALSYSGVSRDFRTITSRVPSIRTLHLGVGEKTVVIDWILSKFRPLKIISLTLHDITYQDSLAVGGLMHAIGDDLQRLDISFRIAPTVIEAAGESHPLSRTVVVSHLYAENIDLSQNTGLRTLIFDDWFMSRWVPTGWSLLILKRIRSRGLRTITFRFRCPNIELLPWDDATPFLNRLPFPEIQLVRLENHAPFTDTLRDREYIHNILPALALKNIVEYVSIPEGIMTKFPWNLLYEG
jgi:hypothetical protein